MAQWWSELSLLQEIVFVIGCAMGAFLIFQIVMMLLGVSDDMSFDADTDVDLDSGDPFNDGGFSIFGLRLLSVRAIVSFLAIGSWTTYVLCYLMYDWAAFLLGLLAGIAAAFLMAYMLKSVEKLQESGNLITANAVGKSGDVYLTIPAKRKGNGKVNVFVQERLSEFEAVTDSDEPIKTGAKVKVVGTINEGTLLVEPF